MATHLSNTLHKVVGCDLSADDIALLMAALTVLINSSSWVEILKETKYVPIWAEMVSSASWV